MNGFWEESLSPRIRLIHSCLVKKDPLRSGEVLEVLVSGIHSQAASLCCLQPTSHMPTSHSGPGPCHNQDKCVFVPTKSQAGWRLQGSTYLDSGPPAPDPLLTNPSVQLSKPMTHFPQGSSPDKLPCGPSLCPRVPAACRHQHRPFWTAPPSPDLTWVLS